MEGQPAQGVGDQMGQRRTDFRAGMEASFQAVLMHGGPALMHLALLEEALNEFGAPPNESPEMADFYTGVTGSSSNRHNGIVSCKGHFNPYNHRHFLLSHRIFEHQ